MEKIPEDYLKEASLLRFEGIECKDIYNPSKPFKYKNALNIAARVEPREDECKSEIVFFRKQKDWWYKNDDFVSLPNFQDDFPKTEAKRKELRNVVYPGGFEVKDDVMEIFLGISDAYAGKAVILNPFKQY